MPNKTKEIKLANPRGFCAGVDRAIDIVNRALEIYGRPVYVKHEVVHNKFVVEDLKSRGAIFVEDIDEIPEESLVIFSAHGVSDEVEKKTNSRNLQYFDATCPLVTKVHMEVMRHARAEKDIILIGHEGHPEVEGTMGRHINKELSNIYLVQDEEEAKENAKEDQIEEISNNCSDQGPLNLSGHNGNAINNRMLYPRKMLEQQLLGYQKGDSDQVSSSPNTASSPMDLSNYQSKDIERDRNQSGSNGDRNSNPEEDDELGNGGEEESKESKCIFVIGRLYV